MPDRECKLRGWVFSPDQNVYFYSSRPWKSEDGRWNQPPGGEMFKIKNTFRLKSGDKPIRAEVVVRRMDE